MQCGTHVCVLNVLLIGMKTGQRCMESCVCPGFIHQNFFCAHAMFPSEFCARLWTSGPCCQPEEVPAPPPQPDPCPQLSKHQGGERDGERGREMERERDGEGGKETLKESYKRTDKRLAKKNKKIRNTFNMREKKPRRERTAKTEQERWRDGGEREG